MGNINLQILGGYKVSRSKLVNIDSNKLRKLIKGTGKSQVKVGTELGRSENFISNVLWKGEISECALNGIAHYFHVDKDFLIKKEEEQQNTSPGTVNLKETLSELKGTLVSLEEAVEELEKRLIKSWEENE